MKRNITIVLILAVFVVAALLFSGAKEKTGKTQISRDAGVSESAEYAVVPRGSSTPISNQKADHEPARSDKGQRLEPEIENAVNELVNTSHEGLVEEKTDNGVAIDLKGRFRTAPVATIDDKGEIVVRDYTSAPGR